MLNYTLTSELRRRYQNQSGSRLQLSDQFYDAITQKWPQFNHRSRVVMVDRPRYIIERVGQPSYTIVPAYRRKAGAKAWWWRLWYEIMVKVGQHDRVLHSRGWQEIYQRPPNTLIDLEFTYFQMQREDFFSAQIEPYAISAAYDNLSDTLYLVKGETEYERQERTTKGYGFYGRNQY